MNARRPTRISLVALGLGTLLAALAAAALANVTVYQNGFKNAADVKQLSKVEGGKRCKRKFRRNSKRLRVTATRGPATCVFRPPVEGDGPRPDHIFRVDGTIATKGPKAARRTAFLLTRVRAGAGSNYELRVYPRGGRFELRRRPNSAQFPITGTDDAIKRIGRLNKVRLVAEGPRVRAAVNGSVVAAVTDSSHEQVSGRRLHFGIAHRLRTTRDFSGNFRAIAVSVPRP